MHPNTLRQRLRRIQDLTGLDVADEDWLMIEIELKLLRLEQALGAACNNGVRPRCYMQFTSAHSNAANCSRRRHCPGEPGIPYDLRRSRPCGRLWTGTGAVSNPL